MTHVAPDPSVGIRGRGCVALMFVGVCGGGTLATSGVAVEPTGTMELPLRLGAKP